MFFCLKKAGCLFQTDMFLLLTVKKKCSIFFVWNDRRWIFTFPGSCLCGHMPYIFFSVFSFWGVFVWIFPIKAHLLFSVSYWHKINLSSIMQWYLNILVAPRQQQEGNFDGEKSYIYQRKKFLFGTCLVFQIQLI